MQEPADLSAIPSGMDNDPRADEAVIDQQPKEATQFGKPIPSADPDELASQLAYALDGSGTGLPGSTPAEGDTQKVTTEGTTGAGLSEEEEALA